MSRTRTALAASVAGLLVLSAASCGSGSSGATADSDGRTATIDVALSDDGCAPRRISAKAGATTFAVANEGTAAVTEFEVLKGGTILGEVENVIPGADRSFSLTLKAGSYTTKCPGGASYETGTLEVADAPEAGERADTRERHAAVAAYLDYVKAESAALVEAVGPFADAVRQGDVDAAKQRFAAARTHYESIEPIAESFGDLDPAIDAREGDVPDDEWTGFHRIEQALWVDGTTDGMAPVADRLQADIADLDARIDGIELEPAQIANGAVELLNEISVSKITGEEDRYSHTDLSDFAANLAGSKAAFESVQPLLGGDDQALSDRIEDRFAAVQAALDQHPGTDPVGNGYVLYDTLSTQDTTTLSTTLDTLAEPLSQVAAQLL